jgi:hypothetical protein
VKPYPLTQNLKTTKNLEIMKCIKKVPKQYKFHQKKNLKNQCKLLKTSFTNLEKKCEKKWYSQVNKD